MTILPINKLLDHTYNETLENISNVINPINASQSIKNYTDIIESIDKTVREIALNLLQKSIEKIDEDYFNSKNRKLSYWVKDKRTRTIITVFGQFTFTRRIYECKSSGKYYTHVDRKLGLPKYDKYDPTVKAQIVELAANSNSMIKVGEIVGERIYSNFTLDARRKNYNISRQTVHNIIKSVKRFNPNINRKNNTPEILYIMADEKYVNLQRHSKDKVMVKHAVVFESLEMRLNRSILKNKLTYTSIDSSFWINFHDHLAKVYDLDKVKQIVIMGDGAAWIKAGVHEFANADFVLDKFHTFQAIEHISKEPRLNLAMNQSIYENDIEIFNSVIDVLKIFEEDNESRLKSIKEKASYIRRHWEPIQKALSPTIPGCSMEAHISHNLASILSSRPKAYSLKMLNKIINLRNLNLNNIDIQNLYLDTLHLDDSDEIQEIEKEVLDFSMFDPKSSYDKSSTSRWLKRFISRN